jgi:TRAP-type C4-dicarboxylate transport system substrate-binding protein
MDRRPSRVLAVVSAFLTLTLSGSPSAQSRSIKLATVVPAGSIWDTTLKQMGTEWEKATDGRVALTVFSGGSQGDEATVLRKMRLDALQAASLTVVGLGSIDWSFNVFSIPFFFESYEELNYVVERLTPTLKKRLESKNFVMLNWGHGGWLQLLTKQPVQTLADLRKLKLYTSAGDDRMTQWYKAHGFQPRAMAMTDILPGLTTGMIEALPTTPLAAMAFQWWTSGSARSSALPWSARARGTGLQLPIGRNCSKRPPSLRNGFSPRCPSRISRPCS